MTTEHKKQAKKARSVVDLRQDILVTLFTNEQTRGRDVETRRAGGPDDTAVRRIRVLCAVLSTVTAMTIGV